jgi:2',3'-cyclic-nucleotide 2'-phosphodiesterase (5'-nucleotidase family)
MNLRLAALTGSSQINAIFNGHTHQTYINPAIEGFIFIYSYNEDNISKRAQVISFDRDTIVVDIQGETRSFNRRNLVYDIEVPIVQAGAYGMSVAQLDFYFEGNTFSRIESKMLNASNTPEFLKTSTVIDDIISPYFLGIQSLIETPILLSGQAYSRNDLTQFMARLMADEVGASVGIHNYGGTRVSLGYLEAITVGKTYEIFPFDNTIKTVYLKGSEIKNLLTRFQNSEVYVQSNTTFLDDTYYKVATNDYLFDKETYPFLTGSDIVSTGILIRDIFIDAVRIQKETYPYFYISQYRVLSIMKETYIERKFYGSFI